MIPSAPFATETYTFTWTLDRQRYRTPIVDDTTHNQASDATVIPIFSTASWPFKSDAMGQVAEAIAPKGA